MANLKRELANSKTAIIHIGLPKTGSTSLQHYLSENKKYLRRRGYDYFGDDFFGKTTHTGLHYSVLRPGVETFSTIKYSNFDQNEVRLFTAKAICQFFAQSQQDKLIFSSEGLSFLRTVEECKQLRNLFPESINFKIVLAMRQKDDWLKSYIKQIYKQQGRTPSQDPCSALYVEDDTWLTDFETLISVYEEVFGKVHIVQFESGDVLREVVDEIGLKNVRSLSAYRFNVSDGDRNSNQRYIRVLGSVKKILRFLGFSKLRRKFLVFFAKDEPKR
jgi:hypothetical protein